MKYKSRIAAAVYIGQLVWPAARQRELKTSHIPVSWKSFKTTLILKPRQSNWRGKLEPEASGENRHFKSRIAQYRNNRFGEMADYDSRHTDEEYEFELCEWGSFKLFSGWHW